MLKKRPQKKRRLINKHQLKKQNTSTQARVDVKYKGVYNDKAD